MNNEPAELILKEAFKRSLYSHLGPIDEKPILELRGWALALLELARECREQQLEIEDHLQDKRTFSKGDLPAEYDPTFPYPEIELGPNAPK